MYRALYRKWRPRTFEDVVGQQGIVAALKNQIATGRVGHAYLFTGTRGTGKTTCAKIFAKAVNCQDKTSPDPCGVCQICKGIDDGSILDVVEIDAASNNGVDNIRDLRDETAYTPSACAYKVYIIDEVHMLSIAAFNALLKIMEEPPSHVIFILATTEIHKVPATILSRCQRYDFGRIKPEDIAARVSYVAAQEQLELTEGAAALIARLADGALRDALSILDTCAGVSTQIDEELVRRMAGVTDRSYLFRISDALHNKNATEALAEVAQLRQQSVDMKRLCEELISHYRNLMLAALPGGKALLSGVAPEEEARYLQTAEGIRQGESVRAIRLLGSALEKMGRGTDQRIELELALFALTETPQAAQQPVQTAPVQNAPVQQAPAFGQQSAAPFAAAPFAAADPAPFAVRQQAEPAAQPQTAQNSAQQSVPAQSQDLPPWELETPPVSAQEAREMAKPAEAPIAAAQQPEPLPWEAEPIQQKEVPPPVQQPQPKRQSLAAPAKGEPPQPFEPWPQVVAILETRDRQLYSHLHKSRAVYDGRRVLIEGGPTFRDFIRVNKESQEILKQIIQEVTGVRCGIGPYVDKSKANGVSHTVEDTLKELAAQGVDVVYNDK
ncbi:DNA polymerase III subunit gamma/tau [Allofournierella massiliensis]|uniref:DNA polymerase III subunit gamma/tau n=1 Tax=Allofournierella massiliensis TaxID=1650663 RepID=UPI0023F01C83|nr:DNA polymerase III subunit gamma/tau [Fournierella massiliensis]